MGLWTMSSQIDPSLPLDGLAAVKADLRDNLQAAKDEIEALQAAKADLQGALLTNPELRAYVETSPTAEVVGGQLTIDLAMGNVSEVTLTENVAVLALTNPPAVDRAGSVTLILRQDGAGGRTVAWPGAVKWAGGTPPLVTSAANAVDVYAFVTRDGGVTWYGFLGGKDFG